MPLTNGPLIEQLVKEAQVKNPQINLTGISGDAGNGLQPYGFAAKQLLNARNGEEVTPQKLSAIAKRLGELLGREINAQELMRVDEEPADADPASQGGKIMIAKSKKNAPAVNAEQGASVSININTQPRD